MKIICVTHSSRPFFEAKCSLNYLSKRFRQNGETVVPPFESFPSLSEAVPYDGFLSLWMIDEANESRLVFLHEYRPGYKVQFAAFYQNRLLVYGSDRLEILDTDFNVIKTVSHPHLVGGHTVHVDKDGFAWATSAPGDLILKVDIAGGLVIEEIPVPDCYGDGIAYGPGDDFSHHYIPTDYQRTHLNSVVPVDDGLLITLWKQGVLGRLGFGGEYKEVARGYVGCHGGRETLDLREYYVTDSPSGIIWFFDRETCGIKTRIQLNSAWVHDSVQMNDDLFVAGLSDRNCIQIFSRKKMEVINEVDCAEFGDSVMFVNCCDIDPAVWKVLGDKGKTGKKEDTVRDGDNLVPSLSNTSFWQKSSGLGLKLDLIEAHFRLTSSRTLGSEAMVQSCEFTLPAGRYRIDAEIECHSNCMTLGVLDTVRNIWVVQLVFDASVSKRKTQFVLDEPVGRCRLVISAFSGAQREAVDATVKGVSICEQVEFSQYMKEKKQRKINILPSLENKDFWTIHKGHFKKPVVREMPCREGRRFVSAELLKFDYLVEGFTLHLTPGLYRIKGEVLCHESSVAVGVLDVKANCWLVQLIFSPETSFQEEFLSVAGSSNDAIKVIFSAANSVEPRSVDMLVKFLVLNCEKKRITFDAMSV